MTKLHLTISVTFVDDKWLVGFKSWNNVFLACFPIILGVLHFFACCLWEVGSSSWLGVFIFSQPWTGNNNNNTIITIIILVIRIGNDNNINDIYSRARLFMKDWTQSRCSAALYFWQFSVLHAWLYKICWTWCWRPAHIYRAYFVLWLYSNLTLYSYTLLLLTADHITVPDTIAVAGICRLLVVTGHYIIILLCNLII